MVLAAVGLALGFAASFLLRRLIAGLLFETSALDPAALSAVGALLLIAALAACWLPSSRAVALDPVRSLRT
jgi:ABC-type antimicrobial peptide transport system permease subunit